MAPLAPRFPVTLSYEPVVDLDAFAVVGVALVQPIEGTGRWGLLVKAAAEVAQVAPPSWWLSVRLRSGPRAPCGVDVATARAVAAGAGLAPERLLVEAGGGATAGRDRAQLVAIDTRPDLGRSSRPHRSLAVQLASARRRGLAPVACHVDTGERALLLAMTSCRLARGRWFGAAGPLGAVVRDEAEHHTR